MDNEPELVAPPDASVPPELSLSFPILTADCDPPLNLWICIAVSHSLVYAEQMVVIAAVNRDHVCLHLCYLNAAVNSDC